MTVTNDICQLHEAGLEMAIADCENIPDNVAKSYQFKKMLQQARLVGKDFKILDRRKIGGNFSMFILPFLLLLLCSFLFLHFSGILLDII